MKKIIMFLIMFLSFNVYAKDSVYKLFTYTVKINGKAYTASVKYELYDNKYSLDLGSISLTDSDGTRYVYNADYNEDGSKNSIASPSSAFYTDNKTTYGAEFDYEFSEEEINNSEFMADYLPKFLTFNDDVYMGSFFGSVKFVVIVANDNNYDAKEREDFYEKFLNYIENLQIKEKKIEIYKQSFVEINGNSDITFGKGDGYNTLNLPAGEYYNIANKIYLLLQEAKDIKVCTEDDLNAIRSQRNVAFANLKNDFNASLSTACYSVLFRNDGLFDSVKQGFNYATNKGASIGGEENQFKMAYLFFESIYLDGFGFLTGETMQKEIKDVARCSIFGDKTYELLQRAFTIFKYVGLVLGTLLGTVDIFKAIVQKDESGKKQVKTLSKRIIAIILLFITPVLVEIIFEFISSIGIDDPICGIR